MNPILLRVLVIAAALAVWFWTQSRIGRKASDLPEIGDGIHRFAEKLHRYFATNHRAADRALIASSFFIDVMGIALIGLSILGQSFAPFIGIIIVFSLRQLSQSCCTLPPPPGMIWRDPGFPSALVTYGVCNDLFFSGHTALAVLGAIEICRNAPPWLGAIAVLVAIGEMAIVLILRAHYTIDVITGALAAWFAADLADRIAPYADRFLQ